MDHEENNNFEKFFIERLRQKNISLKKLSDITGISKNNLENIASGNFKGLPSAPYFRGYVIKLGNVLDFNGEEWWEEIKKESAVKKSGAKDLLPKNRFAKKNPMKYIILAIVILITGIYMALQFRKMIGQPVLSLTFPNQNPYTASSSEITLQGKVSNADSLSINGENINIAPDGTWQKNVLLFSNNQNTFKITAKKFLGSEADLVEQIIYNNSNIQTQTPTTTIINTTNTIEKNATQTIQQSSTQNGLLVH
jgi:cytoskeletal protein RodZ